VVGGGFLGSELACALAAQGMENVLITFNLNEFLSAYNYYIIIYIAWNKVPIE